MAVSRPLATTLSGIGLQRVNDARRARIVLSDQKSERVLIAKPGSTFAERALGAAAQNIASFSGRMRERREGSSAMIEARSASSNFCQRATSGSDR